VAAEGVPAQTEAISPRSTAIRVAFVILAVVVIAALARLCFWAWTQQVSFDGAMNLEVARSLAEGHGYRRMYADRSGFSHEIQSRAPYILPAAAVFAAFGVGIWQSQLTNLLYVAALALLIFLLVRRLSSWRWALVAVAVCLLTPGIEAIAMNGYGEVPALVWWLAALLVLCRPDGESIGNARLLGAALLIGMAVLTKTVLAIGLVAIVPVVVATVVSRDSRSRSTAIAFCVIGAGIVLPTLIYELAHVAAIGDFGRWHAWLRDEIHAIHMQAGTANGFSDTPGVGAKLLIHSKVLIDNLGLARPLLAMWIAGTIVLAAFARRWLPSANGRAVLLSLTFFAAIYFLWWLGFTPTEKAWYRRIFNGVIVLEIVLVLMLAALWEFRRRSNTESARRLAVIACVLLATLQLALIRSAVGEDDTDDFASGGSLRDDLAVLARVPPNAEMYGVGWYSAPILALYSGRRFDNIAAKTPAQLAAASPVFLALDTHAPSLDAAQYWLARYAHRDVAQSDDVRLIEIDANTRLDPFASMQIDDGAVLDRVDFHRDDYPYLFGFQVREGDGWRWVSADAEVLLRYRGEPEFFVDIYVPPLQGYRVKKEIGITASVGSCRLGTFRQDESRRERWWLSARNCPLSDGERVIVRLTSDNLYESRDDRQLGYIVHALGFGTSEPPTSVVPAAQR
jgi:4-amino-4-deoxy-L-arabinose transferase-like glycosyltransferase